MKFEATVRDLASDGRGILTSPEGETCFVAGVWPGEKVRVEKAAKKTKVAEARLLEVIEASDARQTPPCQYHGQSESHCGGCAWQFVTYEAQLAAKQQRVLNQLGRLVSSPQIREIHASPNRLGYRNRAQLKTDGRVIGFEASQSNRLVAIEDCLVLSTKNRNNLHQLIESLPNKSWQVKPAKPRGKQKTGKNKWTTLDIDESLQTGEVSVNQRLPFRQANAEQNRYMQGWLKNQLHDFDKNKIVLELFCGSGNFTQVISDLLFNNIIAVELDSRAIAILNDKKLAGVKAVVANLFDEEGVLSLGSQFKNTDIVVLDPPREGFKHLSSLIKKLKKIRNVFYISCDLATFCRDSRMLLDAGFQLMEVQPLDLFPQTPHVEILAYFKK